MSKRPTSSRVLLAGARPKEYGAADPAELKRLRALDAKLREVLLWGPEGKRMGHGPNVSMLGSEYEELCDLLGAPK